MNATATRAGLLRAILAEPDKDDLRLIYADVSAEEGDETRAELIQVQVELARLPEQELLTVGALFPGFADRPGGRCRRCEKAGHVCRYHVFEDRERELLPTVEVPWVVMDATTVGNTFTGEPPWIFRRGFVEVIILSAESWMMHADALCAATPLREVTLTTWPDIYVSKTGGRTLNKAEAAEANGHRIVVWYAEGPARVSVVRDLLVAQWPRITFTLPE